MRCTRCGSNAHGANRCRAKQVIQFNRSRANRGRSWESLIEGWHAYYASAGWAAVDKTHPPVKILRTSAGKDQRVPLYKRGTFHACWAGSAVCDYVGTLKGGRSVVFDAKDTTQERWELKSLKRHQGQHLSVQASLGAVCFVLLRIRGDAYVLPWDALSSLWRAAIDGRAKRGEGSLHHERLPSWAIPVGSDGWYPALTAAGRDQAGPTDRPGTT